MAVELVVAIILVADLFLTELMVTELLVAAAVCLELDGILHVANALNGRRPPRTRFEKPTSCDLLACHCFSYTGLGRS